jgi:hypothetical protein
MKILLRQTLSRLYYAGRNRWVSKCSLAHDFVKVERAARWLNAARLSGVEIALSYDHRGLRSRFTPHRQVAIDE